MVTPLHATGDALPGERHFVLPCGAHTLSVEPWGPGVFTLRIETLAPLPDSPAALPPAMPLPVMAVTPTSAGWRLALPELVLRVTGAPLTLGWETPEGLPLWGPVTVGVDEGRLTLAGPLLPADGFLGLGEKPGYLDRRGRSYVMWNTDNPAVHVETHDALYQSIPFLVTRHEGRYAGLLLDDPGRAHFDLGQAEPTRWQYQADGPGLRWFALAGPALAEVVRRYADLTGRMPLPPRWALGYHQSRWSYPSAEVVRTIAHELRSRRIPADVIHMDIDYMAAYKVFTWSDERFPDPRGLMAALKEQGLRAVTIVDPGVKREPGYAVHDECLAQGLYVRDAEGAPFVGEVWPGDCLFPDFLRPDARAWWGDWHRTLLEAGVAGIWNDMNEPAVFKAAGVPYEEKTMPDDARHGLPGEEVSHRQAHNLYGLYMGQATREGLARLRPDRRPFVITRAGYAGIQRWAMVWTGDNHSIWSHLEQGVPMCLNLGLSGVPFVGPDTGGFAGDCTPELLVRWMQAGAFFPFFRNHSAMGTRAQEPWAFGPEVEALCRQAIEWRYRLLPYLYTVFREAAETGLPIMRAMALAYPDEPECRALFDQYMLGGDLLVAPVLRPGATQRLVYFPAGRWESLMTGERFEGPAYRAVRAPLEQVPVFLREGAVLPLGPVVQHTGESVETLTLRLGAGSMLTGAWYDDDGETLAYAHGGYTLWAFSARRNAAGLTLAVAAVHHGYASPTTHVRVETAWEGPVRHVSFAGKPLEDWRLECGRLVLTLPLRPGELHVSRG